MLDVKLNREDPARLHEQVAAEIRRSIAEGEASPGDRLPPARHLAAVVGVNTNTVLRALRALRDEGLLEMAPRTAARSGIWSRKCGHRGDWSVFSYSSS